MGAEPERDVVVRVAGHVVALGVGEVLGIAVGRRVHEDDLLALLDRLAADLVVARRHPTHVEHRRDPADELLGGDGHVGAVAQQLVLVGTRRQLEDRARDHRACRLGATVEEEQAVADHRVEPDRLTVDLGRGPDRHDVVGRAALLLLVELRTCTRELERGHDHVVGRVTRTAAAHDRAGRPLHELRPHLVRIAQEQPDHLRGQRTGQIFDELDAVLGGGGIEQPGDRRLDVVLPRQHGAGREATVHQLAALRVQRIVETDDRRVRRQVGAVAALLAVGADEDVLRLLDLDDVVVAGDPPQLVLGVPVDGCVVTHPCVRGVRIAGVELAVEEVDHPIAGRGHVRERYPVVQGPTPSSVITVTPRSAIRSRLTNT